MHALEQLADEQIHNHLDRAERLRLARRHRTLCRAQALEHKAERRMIQAWRRAAELHARIESLT